MTDHVVTDVLEAMKILQWRR